jgi:hypothetical protein
MPKNFVLFAFLLPLLHGIIFFFMYEFKFLTPGHVFQRIGYSLGSMMLCMTVSYGFLTANAVFLTICAYFIRKKPVVSMIAAVDSIAVFTFLISAMANDLNKKSWMFVFIIPPLSFALTHCLVSLRKIGALPEGTVMPASENQAVKKGMKSIIAIVFYMAAVPLAGGVMIASVKGFYYWQEWPLSLPRPFDSFHYMERTNETLEQGVSPEMFKIFLHGFYIGPLFYLIQRAWAKIARGMGGAPDSRFRAVWETSLLFAVHVLVGFFAFHLIVADRSVIFTSAYWEHSGLLLSVVGILTGVAVFLLREQKRETLPTLPMP